MSAPIEAIDVAAAKIQKLYQVRILALTTGGTEEAFSRDMAEEWARQILEEVKLRCLEDWQVCGTCGYKINPSHLW